MLFYNRDALLNDRYHNGFWLPTLLLITYVLNLNDYLAINRLFILIIMVILKQTEV